MTQRLDYESLAPKALQGLGSVHAYVSSSGLPGDLVDLIYLRVSQINGCAYCIDLHARDARKRDVSVEKLLLVSAWREGGRLFSERERAALAWAESLTHVSTTGAPDADFAAVSAQFSAQEVTDLTVAIALMNAYNRIGVGFRKPPSSAADA